MKRLQLIVTRFYHPITLERWYKGATAEMKKQIGVGFTDVIFHFDGKKVDVYRIADEVNIKIREGYLKYAKTKKFMDGLGAYKRKMKIFRQKVKHRKSIKEIFSMFAELYPTMTVAYYLSNIFGVKDKAILGKCTQYRKIANPLMDDLNHAVNEYIKKKRLPYFTTMKGPKPWMKKEFCFSKGEFYDLAWEDFLKKMKYVADTKKIVFEGKLKGNPAYAGKANGKVKIIFSPEDFSKINKGDIIATPMTQINYEKVMRKASAIITDEGGITCHAAIISREMRIPCIVGTKIATKVLKDNDLVEVDADKGVVRRIGK